jgi:LysM repeat protein
MDDDTPKRDRHDDPDATGPLWPLPDEADADADRTRRVSRVPPADELAVDGAARRRAPDSAETFVLSREAARRATPDSTRVAADGGRDWLDEARVEAPPAALPRRRAGRPRAPHRGPAWPRIVAPVVLLVAVLAVVTIGVHTGVLSHKPAVRPSPTAAATHKATSAYVYYRVRKGDTVSAIAARYGITVQRLLTLNPKASSTIVVGQRLKVPRSQ